MKHIYRRRQHSFLPWILAAAHFITMSQANLAFAASYKGGAQDGHHELTVYLQTYKGGGHDGHSVATSSDTALGYGEPYKLKFITIPSTLYEVKTTALFDHPPCTYLELDSSLLHMIDITSKGLLARVTNDLTTDKLAIANMTGKTVVDAAPKTTHFIYTNREDLRNVIPEIAWQTNKGVRRTRLAGEDVYELIDFTVKGAPVFAFTDHNVLRGSIKYGFTEESSLKTVFMADFQTNDNLAEIETIKYRKNVAKYGEKILDTDMYVYKEYDDADVAFQWWRDKLSKVYYSIKFTGFLDAFGLELWDRVSIDFGDSRFYDPTKGSPFSNTHTATPIGWRSEGLIKSIRPNFSEGLIEFTVELDTVLGESPQSNIRSIS